MLHPVLWQGDHVALIDQTRLPHAEIWRRCTRWDEVADAIRTMAVRGAPAIGIAAAMGVALAAQALVKAGTERPLEALAAVSDGLAATRPTAVNLFWALRRMGRVAAEIPATGTAWAEALIREAQAILAEDVAMCQAMGRHGAELVPPEARILTHCNAGGLATGGYGTAVGVIRAAHEQGKVAMVYVDETRPWLQGARLTAWEMGQESIEHRLITDNMAGYFLHRGQVDLVVVGADRITANGDVANKIGTYSLAVLAKENNVPFYVVAPSSTFDLSLADGSAIPIEERASDEVTHLGGTAIAPSGTTAANPAFDVTPHRYVTAIVTEQGVHRPPYHQSLAGLQDGRARV